MKFATLLLTTCILLSNTALAHNGEHLLHSAMQSDIQQLKKKNQRLSKRIKKLEHAIATLRSDMDAINTPPTEPATAPTTTVHSCLLITQRIGSYFAKGRSRTEAKAKAIGKCEKDNIIRLCHDDARFECDSTEM